MDSSVRTLLSGLVAGFCLLLPAPASAVLQGNSLDGLRANVNLVYSRLTVEVGPQWLDIEEEAEVGVTPRWGSTTQPWSADGTFQVPLGTAITGCMLWNGDTLLMGMLRGKAEANKIYDSLVPPHTTSWPIDPLLVEQLSETVYNLKLFPIATEGTRRFRIRYLVPRPAGTNEIDVHPLMASSVTGTVPASFRLRLRGQVEGVRLVQSSGVWPVDAGSSETILLGGAARAKLRWLGATGDRAMRASIASGATAGDYVLYSGTLPDTILSKVGLRSETVVLWKWVNPRGFLYDCYGTGGTSRDRCVSSDGWNMINQGSRIREISNQMVRGGNKVGMVADEGLDDTSRVFPLGDSASKSFRQMTAWLQGLGEAYLEERVPVGVAGGSPNAARDLARSRDRFRIDLREAAVLYSADSGIVRHLLVVTAGPQATQGALEDADASILPAGISVSTSYLIGAYQSWDYASQTYRWNAAPEARWPGIDLAGLASQRSNKANLEVRDGAWLPRLRESFPVRLSITGSNGKVGRNSIARRGADGRFRASLEAHGLDLSRGVRWAVYDEQGNELRTWDAQPEWATSGDSIVPRLWAKSEAPMSLVFEDRDLGPLFGVVDPYHSLLATPSDWVGVERQAKLLHEGVPFLTAKEIFPRQGYGQESTPGGDDDPATASVRSKASRSVLGLSWIAGTRTLRISLEGLQAQGIEIRDLRGRIVGIFTVSQLAGLKTLDWQAPAALGPGMLLVSVRTPTGTHTQRVMMP